MIGSMGDPARYDGSMPEPPYRTATSDLEDRVDELMIENASLRAQLEAQRGWAVVVSEWDGDPADIK